MRIDSLESYHFPFLSHLSLFVAPSSSLVDTLLYEDEEVKGMLTPEKSELAFSKYSFWDGEPYTNVLRHLGAQIADNGDRISSAVSNGRQICEWSLGGLVARL